MCSSDLAAGLGGRLAAAGSGFAAARLGWPAFFTVTAGAGALAVALTVAATGVATVVATVVLRAPSAAPSTGSGSDRSRTP